jgi:putative spermidine/putrescine transport system permease protein
MILPVLLLLSFSFLLPYLYMIYVSFMTPAAIRTFVPRFTSANYLEVLTDAYNWQVFGRTFGASALITLISLVMAYPVAYHLARSRGKRQSVLLLVILSPLLIGDVIRAYGWMILLANSGLINTLLRQLNVVASPLPLMFNLFGIGVGLVHIYIPFMVLTVAGALQTIDPELEHMAHSLGAGPWRTFRQIVWPLSLPGVYAGSILVFVQAVGAYAIPTLLGGFRVITAPILVTQTAIGTFNWPLASALAIVLFLISILIIGIYSTLLLRRVRGTV